MPTKSIFDVKIERVAYYTLFFEEFFMWPFARRASQIELNSIGEQQQQTLDAIATMNEQLSKFVRWSYRNQKNSLDILQTVQTDWNTARETESTTIQNLEASLEQLSWDLVNWIDELDALLHAASQGSAVGDQSLILRWLDQLTERLHSLGFEEYTMLGQTFDPRVAEALGTTSEWIEENGRPPRDYVVVYVLRRGFRRNGALLRKAQVVVYVGETKEPNPGGFSTDEPR